MTVPALATIWPARGSPHQRPHQDPPLGPSQPPVGVVWLSCVKECCALYCTHDHHHGRPPGSAAPPRLPLSVPSIITWLLTLSSVSLRRSSYPRYTSGPIQTRRLMHCTTLLDYCTSCCRMYRTLCQLSYLLVLNSPYASDRYRTSHS